jgi:hypothetical protein
MARRAGRFAGKPAHTSGPGSVYDRLVEFGAAWAGNYSPHSTPRELAVRLAGVPVIDVSAVARYFEHCYVAPARALSLVRDVPVLAPPFPALFVEFSGSARDLVQIAANGVPASTQQSSDRIGVLMESIDLGANGRILSEVDPDTLSLSPGQKTAEVLRDHAQSTGKAPVRWLVECTAFTSKPATVPSGPIAGWVLALDPDGRAVKSSTASDVACWLSEDHIAAADSDVVKASMRYALLDPVLLAICFMHARNGVALEATPEPPRSADTAYRVRTGRPLVRAQVLQIDAVKNVIEAARASSEAGGDLLRALHLCRGHFATYTQDKPLFGKLTGTFYVPAHLRGSGRAGVVLSDYEVRSATGDVPD